MRLMGVDYGEKRIGVAVTDPLGWTAQPYSVIERKSLRRDLEALREIAVREEVGRIVLGLPRNMNGSYGPAAAKSRDFGEKLAALSGLPVDYWDERLTTVAAERTLLAADLSRSRRKEVIDKVAATIILEGYLQSRPRES